MAAVEAISRSLASTTALYGEDSEATAMCNLRLGTILMGMLRWLTVSRSVAGNWIKLPCSGARLPVYGFRSGFGAQRVSSSSSHRRLGPYAHESVTTDNDNEGRKWVCRGEPRNCLAAINLCNCVPQFACCLRMSHHKLAAPLAVNDHPARGQGLDAARRRSHCCRAAMQRCKRPSATELKPSAKQTST